jgi:transposase
MAQQKYTAELRKEIIEAIIEGDRSAAQVATDYDINKTTVYGWMRAYKLEHDMARLELKNETPEQEIKRLRAELKQARQERDILKKATAYFASLEK